MLVRSYPYGKSQSSTYIDFIDDKVWFGSAKGTFGYFDYSKSFEKKFTSTLVQSNIHSLIQQDNFFLDKSEYGIKDILINEGKIYVSYTREIKKDCFNISILSADLDEENLKFDLLFQPKDCVNKINDRNNYHAIQSGGRMQFLNDNILLLTHGDFRNRSLAQNKNSSFGKVLRINILTNQSEVIAMGLRNSQGMFFDKNKNILFLTDHGPKGGDEINFLSLKNTSQLKNFGWPVSSYGEHYYGRKYDDAPLHKSHKKFNFEEPIKYFKNSIAISELAKINNDFAPFLNNQLNIVVSSMGDDISEGDMSLHFFSLDSKMSISNHEIMIVNERIRDLKFIEDKNELILFLESGEIAFLKKV